MKTHTGTEYSTTVRDHIDALMSELFNPKVDGISKRWARFCRGDTATFKVRKERRQ